MKTLEELKTEYQKLDKEAGKYNHPEFTKVYEVIDELVKDRIDVGDKGNLAFPLVSGDVIDKALIKLGFDKNKRFVSDFKKYREIEQQARDIQLEMITHPQHPVKEIINDKKIKKSGNWRFVQIKIAVPEFMYELLKEKLSDDVKTLSGLYGVKTDVVMEDENDDNFLAIEAFGVRSSLEPYYRELQEYKILEKYFNYQDLKNAFLSILLETVIFISNNTSSPNKIRNKISKVIIEFDKYGGIGVYWQILILQGIIRWIENIDINKGDYGYKELENLLNWAYEFIMEKLVFYTYYNWGEKELSFLEPLSNYLFSTEVGKEVQKSIFKDNNITTKAENIIDVKELNSSKNINNSSISYIDRAKKNTLVYGDGWANGKCGQISDLLNDCQFRFFETDENGMRFLQNDEEKLKLPTIATGFVGWLIKNWGAETKKIFEEYKNIKLNQYKDKHKNAPDAHKRDLEKEFFEQYRELEEQWVNQSKAINPFLSNQEVELIDQYVANYFEYINQFMKLPYKVYKTFDEAINDISIEEKIILHTLNKILITCNRLPLHVFNDYIQIMALYKKEPAKCLNIINKNYNRNWKEYILIINFLKKNISRNSDFYLLLPDMGIHMNTIKSFDAIQNEIRKQLTVHFVLSYGVVLSDDTLPEKNYSIHTITDEVAVHFLATQPETRKKFSVLPENVDELINEYKIKNKLDSYSIIKNESEEAKELIDPIEIFKSQLILRDDKIIHKIYKIINENLINSSSKNLSLALFTQAFIEKKYLLPDFNKSSFHSAMKKAFGNNVGSRAKFNEKLNEITKGDYENELKMYKDIIP